MSKNPLRCMCGHIIISVEEIEILKARKIADNWSNDKFLDEVSRLFDLNAEKIHDSKLKHG